MCRSPCTSMQYGRNSDRYLSSAIPERSSRKHSWTRSMQVTLRRICGAVTVAAVALTLSMYFTKECLGEDPLFADDFNNGLSSKWQVVGLQKEDYRIRDGGLELRVQPGKRTADTPMLKVILPFATTSTVIASVDVTILDEFTEEGEFGGLCLIADDGVEFTVRKQRVNGSLVFAPGKYDFIGKPGDEGEPRQYTIKYWPALDESEPLRIIVRQTYAHFQVGPSSEDKFLNFFHSAIVDSDKKCGFSLVAAGGPKDAVHWVRFDNFRVTR